MERPYSSSGRRAETLNDYGAGVKLGTLNIESVTAPAEAAGDAARFSAVAAQYSKAPQVTSDRLH